eukprot:3207809-Amphidinium_carterae.1
MVLAVYQLAIQHLALQPLMVLAGSQLALSWLAIQSTPYHMWQSHMHSSFWLQTKKNWGGLAMQFCEQLSWALVLPDCTRDLTRSWHRAVEMGSLHWVPNPKKPNATHTHNFG